MRCCRIVAGTKKTELKCNVFTCRDTSRYGYLCTCVSLNTILDSTLLARDSFAMNQIAPSKSGTRGISCSRNNNKANGTLACFAMS